MHITHLHISAFGSLTDVDMEVSPGLNIIDGENESGKSTVAMFIKFIFYGLSARSSAEVSEKQRAVNWSRGYASGYAVCAMGDRVYRIERTLTAKTSADGKPKFSESMKILDHGTSMPEKISVSPGEFFFKVPESVFMNSAFAQQDARLCPDSSAIREAMENILSAADASVNVRRAEDILEKSRIRLLHKNRTGGEIAELELERDRLEAASVQSSEMSSALISAELSLAEVKNRIEETKARSAELEALSEALGAIDALRKKDKLAELRLELDRCREKLRECANGCADEKFIAALAGSVRDLEKAAQLRNEMNGRSAESDNTVALTAVSDCRSASRRASRGTAVGLALLIIGLLGFIGGAYLMISAMPGVIIALIAGAAAALGGAASLIIASVSRRKMWKILDRLELDNEDELDEASEKYIALEEDEKKLRLELEAAQLNERAALETIAELSRSAHLEGETDLMTGARAAARLGKYVSESTALRKKLESECARLEGQISENEAAMKAFDGTACEALLNSEIGRRASEMTEDEIVRLRRERAFRAEQSDVLRARELELEREFATLRASAKSPAAIRERISELEEKIRSKRALHDAYVKALDTIRAAGEGLRASVLPRLTADASEIMKTVTCGRYGKLAVTSGFDMSVVTRDFGTREADYLSAGTRDAAYLALRLALVRALFDKDSRPPVILDESFAYLDEKRVEEAVSMLEASGVQCFLFTCRGTEASASHGCAKYHLPSRNTIG